MNIAIVTGNLGKTAVTSKFSNGNTKYAFSMATSGGYNDTNGNWIDQTEWHTVLLFLQKLLRNCTTTTVMVW